MLDASDSDYTDNVIPFLGTLVDSMCGLFVTTEVTKELTENVDRVNFLFRRDMHFEWNEESIQHLETCIRSFNENA